MATKKTKRKKEQPLSLHGLNPEEVLKRLLQTPPPKKKKSPK